MFRKQALLAPFVASAIVTALALFGCDGKAHGTDLYGGTSSGGNGGTSSGSTSGGSDPDRSCNAGTQPGDWCPRSGEGTCYSNNGTLVCVDGVWGLDPTIDFPPPPPPACPAYEPANGEYCYASPVLNCSYFDRCPDRPSGSSGTRYYQCSPEGQWKRQDAYVASCPSLQPIHGQSCAACIDSYPAQCTYFDGKGCGPAVLSCDPVSQRWEQIPTPCPPPPPDAGAGP